MKTKRDENRIRMGAWMMITILEAFSLVHRPGPQLGLPHKVQHAPQSGGGTRAVISQQENSPGTGSAGRRRSASETR